MSIWIFVILVLVECTQSDSICSDIDITIESELHFNQSDLPIQDTVYDWLTNNTVEDCFKNVSIPVCCSDNCVTSVPILLFINSRAVPLNLQTTRIEDECHGVETPLPVSGKLEGTTLTVDINAQATTAFCYTGGTLRECPGRNCTDRCIRKCCPPNQLYDYSQRKCSYDAEFKWSPRVYDTDLSLVTGGFEENPLIHGFPKCPSFSLSGENAYYLLQNSSIYVNKYDRSYDNSRYCSDYFRKGTTVHEEAVLCFPQTTPSEDKTCTHVHSNIYPILLAISVLFLALTLIVYSLLPDLNSKLNGRCVMASTASLMAGYLCFIANQWNGSISMVSCQILGLASQFFILVSFFWMNVMCYDVWRALRSTRFVASVTSSVNKRFAKFCLYAFGCPFLICFSTACVQFIPSDSAKNHLIDPGLGQTGCFFTTKDLWPWWVYFYGFILVVLLINSFFFFHLLFLLHRDRMNADAALHRRKKRHVMWLKLYAKLFVLMGLTWIFEVVSWLEGTCNWWIWIDSINALRGFFIFLIFVCKRSIWRKLLNENVIMSSFKSTSSSKTSKRSQFHVEGKLAETPA